MPHHVLITGQLRDAVELFHKLEALDRWRSEGLIDEVIISTWKGEIERHCLGGTLAKRTRLTVVEDDEPRLMSIGNIIHQNVAIQNGLDLLPDDCTVLKGRVDKSQFDDRVKQIVTDGVPPLSAEAKARGVFRRKIVCESHGFLFAPFYISDFRLFGCKEDISSLLNFDLKTYLFSYMIAPEQYFFSAPFARKIGIIKDFNQIFWGSGHYPSNPFGFAKFLLSNEFYRDVFSLSLLICSEFFSEKFRCFDDFKGPLDTSLGYEDVLYGRKQWPEITKLYNDIHYDGVVWKKAILENSFTEDALGVELQEALKRARAALFDTTWNATAPLSRSASMLQEDIYLRFGSYLTNRREHTDSDGFRRISLQRTPPRIQSKSFPA